MGGWKKKLKAFIKKHSTELLLVIGCILFAVNYVAFQLSQDSEVEEMLYPDFVERLAAGDVDTVYYSPSSEYMTVTFLNNDTREMSREERDGYEYQDADKRRVLYPAYEEFRKTVLESGANIRTMNRTSMWAIAGSAVSLIFPIMLVVMMFTMMRGQLKSVTEKDLIHSSDIRFSDVIGQEEIIDDLRFIAELIKDPKKGDTVGAKIPKGLLLQGPPGTGKTLIAKAIAGEAGVPFLQQSASGFIEMYVGLGARRVRDLFKLAKKHAPCIIFIDEIDAIGGNRDNTKGTSENEQTINALLEQMDGFTGRDGVFVIAATNRADKLDPALIRPGRFDRQVTVNPPRDWVVRKDLFLHYLNKFKVADDVNIESLSKQVTGFTGADIAAICNEASIIAIMQDKPAIDMACIEEAIDKKIFKGNRSKRKQYEDDRRIVAYHESGHAVMSWLLGEPISRASIQSTISGVGGVVFNAEKETVFSTDKDFRNRIMILYAGRASEEIKFQTVTTGASNDITQATKVMTQYVEQFGFDSSFGLLDMSVLSREHLVDAKPITDRLSNMSRELYKDCLEMLKANYCKVEALAAALLEKETVSGSDIETLLAAA